MPQIQLKRFSRANVNQSSLPIADTPLPTIQEEPNYDADDDADDDFLTDLGNDVFVSEVELEKKAKENEKEQKKRETEERKYERMQSKEAKLKKDSEKEEQKKAKQLKREEDDQMFSEKGTELYGRDKLQLIAKISQYKILFPDNKQLKLLKVKRNVGYTPVMEMIYRNCRCG